MSRFPGATWTSSHVYGEGSANQQLKLCYFHIPKCASMWMRKYLSIMPGSGWSRINFVTEDLTDFVPLIILRDPVRRWISNCPAREKMPIIAANINQTDNLFDNLESWLYDEHSTKQTDFIAGLDLSRAVYFYCDSDLARNVEHFFHSRNVNFDTPGPINEQETDPVTKRAAKTWQELLSRPKYYSKFREVFAADYALIESVRFYKHDN